MSHLPITPPPLPSAPPTAPGAIPTSRPPVWPRVLGISAIILGVLGALSGAWGILATLFVFSLGFGMPAALEAWQQHWKWWMVLSAAASFCLGLFLLISGIGVTKARRWGRTAILAWAACRSLWAALAAAITIPMIQEQMRIMSSQTSGAPRGVGTLFAALSAAFTLVWGLAPAVFVIVWFNRRAIRAQTALWT